MPRKKSLRNRFNWFERILQKTPTWLAITGVVIPLAIATVLLNVSFDESWSSRRIALESCKAVFENLESIAIISAVTLYFKESPDRRDQKHREAWQVIDMAAAGGQSTSYARFKALEELNSDNVSLRGLDVPSADLQNINLQGAYLGEANLIRVNLQEADLREANLMKANLEEANLNGAKLNGANLWGANLNGAKLWGANLEEADLAWASLKGADFWDTELKGCRVSGVTGLSPDEKEELKRMGACFESNS